MAADGAFIFAHLPNTWLVPVVLAVAALAAWWGWRQYGPTPGGRLTGLVARTCRAAALALLVLAIAGPAWRLTTTTITPGSLLIAVDGSASMAVTDGPGKAPRILAAGDLAAALAGHIDPNQTSVAWALVCAGPRTGSLDPQILADSTSCTALATGGNSAIADDLDRLVARQHPDALVVVTDGRITDGASFTQLADGWRTRAGSSSLRLAVLATGTTAVVPDLSLDEVVVNREAALNEREPVLVTMSHRGLPPGPLKLTLQVDDEPAQELSVAQGTTSDPAVMATAEARTEAVFRHEGTARLTVRVEAGGHRASQSLTVAVRERKLTLLLLDSRPRYEVRYLREAFKRDRTVTLHAYLSEDRWRRWGNEGPERLPLTSADLAAYDAVILGDLGPDAFRATDLANLDAAVRKNGMGLVWLPGETGATAGFAGQKLGELLPAELGDATSLGRGYLGQPRFLSRTDTAKRLGLLEPGETDWSALPRLLGAAPLGTVTPGAEILAQDQDGKPLVVSRNYGAGRAVLVGVDDTWRWRRDVGDRFLHRFHSQLLRFAAANHRGDRRAWRLAASPRRAAPGEPLVLSLAPLRPDAEVPTKAVARLIPTGEAAGRREQLIPLVRDGDGFAARLATPAAGTWELAIAAGPDLATVETGDLLVVPASAERRDPRADRDALAAWASSLGGSVHDNAADLVAHLATDLRHSESHTAVSGLWDTGWALALIVTLLAIDWALRRLNRLP